MKLEQITDEVRAFAATLQPAYYSGPDAARLAEAAAEGERLFATVKVLLAKQAADTGGWTRTSHAVSVEQWLAGVSGSSETAAREALATADRLDALPATAEKLRAGELSVAQAAQVTEGAAIDPRAERHLLAVAGRAGMRGLRAEKERVIAAATDEREAHALAVRERHVRTWTRGMATHGSFSGPTEQVAILLAALDPGEKEAFETARTGNHPEPRDAYRFDALIGLADQALTGTLPQGTAGLPVGRVRVDLNRLLGGEPTSGEVCEIPGVGPVPVEHARKVLSHGLLELVITDGVDVQTVVTTTRHVPKALKIAIEERDPTCKVRDCDRDQHLERHHVEEFAPNQITSYQILGNVCPIHHDLITYRGYTIVENQDGSWSLRAPPNEDAA